MSTIAAFVLLAASSASAQRTPSKVIGKVVDSVTGKAIANAQVYVNDLNAMVETSADGSFELPLAAKTADGRVLEGRVPADSLNATVNVRVRAIGYVPTFMRATIGKGTQAMNFALVPDANRGEVAAVVRSGPQGQGPGRRTVTGRVTDLLDGAPIPTATILVDPTSGARRTIGTDPGGSFVFTMTTDSTNRIVTMRAVAPGYIAATPRTIQVFPSRGTITADFVLRRSTGGDSLAREREIVEARARIAEQAVTTKMSGGVARPTIATKAPPNTISKSPAAQLGGRPETERARVAFGVAAGRSRPGESPAPAADPFNRFLFPPEQVMLYQDEIGLSEAQRAKLQQSIEDAQKRAVSVQWALALENEKLTKMLDSPTVDEKEVIAQMDRTIGIEREMKRAQMTLLIQIKNTLTPEQQMRLRRLRDGSDDY